MENNNSQQHQKPPTKLIQCGSEEFWKILNEHEEEKAKVEIKDGYVTLRFEGEYDIALSRIETERALLCWVNHLSEKEWMTSYRLNIFIERVAEFRGFNLTAF